MIHLTARFPTPSAISQVAQILLGMAVFYQPRRTDDAAYPWSVEVKCSWLAEAQVLRTIGIYGGVTYQEDESEEGGVSSADLS